MMINHKMITQPLCLIFGTHVNAHSIIASLRALDVSSENIHIVKLKNYYGYAAEFFNQDISVWEIDSECEDHILQCVRQRFGTHRLKVLFFTNEKFHPQLSKQLGAQGLNDIRYFLGTSYVDILLDRYLFYDFIKENTSVKVPKTFSGEEDPFKYFENGCVVRPRKSWDRKTRNIVNFASTREQLKGIVESYKKRGLTREALCYQEILSVKPIHTISASGWYDRNYQDIIFTRKVLQHPEPFGNGDVIERIKPPQQLKENTVSILSLFEYNGPFELEWVYDEKKKIFKVIELNPRFWMQHGLIEAISGHDVVARYLGVNITTGPFDNAREIRYWVNPMYAVYRAFKGDFRGIRYLTHAASYTPFTVGQGIKYAPYHVWRKKKQKLSVDKEIQKESEISTLKNKGRKGKSDITVHKIDKNLCGDLFDKYGNVFTAPQWLTLYDGRLNLYGVYLKGELQAFFTFAIERKFGLHVLWTPPMTQHCGFTWVGKKDKKRMSSFTSWQKSVMEAVADFIDRQRCSVVSISFPLWVTDLQPFFWRGYKLLVFYTYILNLKGKSDEDLLFPMNSTRRNEIRNAYKKGLKVQKCENYRLVETLVKMTFERQGVKYDKKLIERVFREYARGENTHAFVVFQQSRPVAASFFAHDRTRAYCILGGFDNTRKVRGAGPLALFNAVKCARDLGLECFDFGGSSIPGIEAYLRNFGGALIPRYRVVKARLPLEMALKPFKRNLF